MNEIINFQVILTLFENNQPNTTWVLNGQTKEGYTSFEVSEMESYPLGNIFWGGVQVTWNHNLPISRERNITLTIKMPSRDPP